MESKSVARMESRASDVSEDTHGDNCAHAVDNILKKKRVNFLCCVDGSTFGDYTLEAAFNLVKKHDHVTVFHAFKQFADESKIFPVEYRPKQMKLKYECELVGHLSSSRYSIWWTMRENGKDRNAVEELQHEMFLRRKADDFPDFILMGHVGRKGKKNTETTLGSNSDASLRALYVPVIIVKQPCPNTAKTFMLAVNASGYSERGLDIFLQLIRPRDKLILFHFYSTNSDDEYMRAKDLRVKYEEELDMYGPTDSSFELIEKDQGKSLSHCMVNYVNKMNPTFLGICPRGKSCISSVSEYVVNNVVCSVVFCKT